MGVNGPWIWEKFEGLLKRCWIRQTNPMLDFEDGKHLWLLKILVKATMITIFSIFTIFYVKRILTVPVTIFSIFSFFMLKYHYCAYQQLHSLEYDYCSESFTFIYFFELVVLETSILFACSILKI